MKNLMRMAVVVHFGRRLFGGEEFRKSDSNLNRQGIRVKNEKITKRTQKSKTALML